MEFLYVKSKNSVFLNYKLKVQRYLKLKIITPTYATSELPTTTYF